MEQAEEINFDGIVGPTHNYSGLSYGNLASMEHGSDVSNPKKAALEGLSKMHTLMKLGIKQAVLPPHERPFIPLLRTIGYEGPDDKIVLQVAKENPTLLRNCMSAAAMWTANAGTMSPSTDSADGKVHFTPANLINQFHRSFEIPTTAFVLHRIFDNPNFFIHHFGLPPHPNYSDEGAANHTRFCKSYGEKGVQLFVYGKNISQPGAPLPKKFPPRQTNEASMAVARLHKLDPNQVIFAQQNPTVIDAGVFHNDVIAVGNQNVFLYHEKAYVDTNEVIRSIQEKIETPIHLIPVTEDQISVEESVKTYFFNSQIVTKPDQTMVLIAPQECLESDSIQRFLKELLERTDHPIKEVIYQEVRESMKNGGGPACLRFRVVLNPKEIEAMSPFVLLTESLYQNLVEWVNKHYRDRLSPQDLADPKLMVETRKALDELSWLLQLGSIYPFQRQGGPNPR